VVQQPVLSTKPCLTIRLEKATKIQLEWFENTAAAGLPEIKVKLGVLHPVAQHLSIHDDLNGFEELWVESDDSWLKGDRDFIKDGLTTTRNSRQRSPTASQEYIPSTFPSGSRMFNGQRRLGMGHPGVQR